ncbi:PREDICTED: uncharacterized protein C7orf73-like [Elephantulus edwardii]|uniref:uncharacterized protein C7orf73-like n=1 Tax=Elephantulus edwardii TaxID=28737 RepID=UPI0003F099B7|nr:PREDICTED: uncharacterized protein C7orf73-like [Elephantulus edwardii]
MLQFLPGFIFGNIVRMFPAQNYEIPNLAEKREDLDAKNSPPARAWESQRLDYQVRW